MILRQVLTVSFGALVALLFVWLEPFNLDDGSASSIRSFWGRIGAFDYPVEKSPKTVAIVIDDNYLRDVGATWPIPLADPEGLAPVTHADILSSIADLEPRAIFFNFKYVDNRNDAQTRAFADTLKRTSASTPVYLAANADPSLPVPALAAISATAQGEESGVQFVSIARGKTWGDTFAYPIWSAEERSFTAAAKLYLDGCERKEPCSLSEASLPMDPQWSAPVSTPLAAAAADLTFNCDQLKMVYPAGYRTSCEEAERSGLERAFREALRNTPFGPKNPVLVGHIPVVTPDFLSNERIQSNVRGAVVFVGSNLGMGDSVVSPLHGAVPVVMLHAIAYDNLVAFGGEYARAEPPFGLPAWIYQAIVIAAVAVAVLAVRIGVGLASKKASADLIARRQKVAEFGAQVVVLGIWILLDMAVFHSGPWVWGGVFVGIFSGSIVRSMGIDRLIWRKRASETI